MKIKTFSFAILLFSTFTMIAQTSDKFIKIIGNAKTELVADGISATLVVGEIQPNEYRQIRYKPIETVYQNLVTNLTKLGLKETELKRDIKTMGQSGYQNVKNERYILIVSNAEQLTNLMKTDLEGVTVQEVKYIYKTPTVELEEQLAIDAIRDAERKAKKIAKEVGKKVGKIVNIEDKSNGSLRDLDENRERAMDKTMSKSYKVNVVFELLD